MLKPQTQIWIDHSPTLVRMAPQRARICLRYAGADSLLEGCGVRIPP
jgi:hypothetical protein